MRDGRWTTVPAEKRLQVYHKAFADDVMRLEAADAVINLCHERADAKFKGRQGDGCDVAYDAIECFWRHTN
ncbi:hypothetical protein R5R35_013353 [Gryllus longicercus]|uniref:Odorant binding protein n=1 Tax=Gryllus longicercus TaxID=2509291 RepID=A0AAN9VTI0_9ORTH